MPQYVIERTLPGAGSLSADQLKDVAQKANGALEELGPSITWEHSYVTGDKLYCVYAAPNAEIIREHAERSGLPADRVQEVTSVINPATAD